MHADADIAAQVPAARPLRRVWADIDIWGGGMGMSAAHAAVPTTAAAAAAAKDLTLTIASSFLDAATSGHASLNGAKVLRKSLSGP